MPAIRSAEAARTRAAAPVLEVFASIQGEGAHVGEPQVFLRLAGCPLRCLWCDTPDSWVPRERDEVLTPSAAAERVAAVEPGRLRTVSVTGGEPLLWPEFVRGLRAELAPRRVHLETAGGHPRALARVLDAVDHVSLDLKLPADLDEPVWADPAPGGESHPRDEATWRVARRACLELVAGRDACAKLIVADGRSATDYAPLLDDLARLAPDVPLVVQPVTPVRGVAAPPTALLFELLEGALARGLEARVLPQVHAVLGVR